MYTVKTYTAILFCVSRSSSFSKCKSFFFYRCRYIGDELYYRTNVYASSVCLCATMILIFYSLYPRRMYIQLDYVHVRSGRTSVAYSLHFIIVHWPCPTRALLVDQDEDDSFALASTLLDLRAALLTQSRRNRDRYLVTTIVRSSLLLLMSRLQFFFYSLYSLFIFYFFPCFRLARSLSYFPHRSNTITSRLIFDIFFICLQLLFFFFQRTMFFSGVSHDSINLEIIRQFSRQRSASIFANVVIYYYDLPRFLCLLMHRYFMVHSIGSFVAIRARVTDVSRQFF